MKSIYVPVDNEAMIRLDFDTNVDGDLLEVNLSDEVYQNLEGNGFFTQINKLTGANIDSFEDDCITDLDILRRVVDSSFFEQLEYDNTLISVVKQIKAMFIEAINRETGVFFYF